MAGSDEVVVLLDADGNATGRHDKASAHHANTPLHLAFSCYVFDAGGRILMTRRAADKAVFPGVLTNTCCGHPAPGEPVANAVLRRTREELGLALDAARLRLVLPAFAYRAEMDGVVENEMCPVFAAFVDADPPLALDSAEVGDVEWRDWPTTRDAILHGSLDVSPWCALQVRVLAALGDDAATWPAGDPALLPPAARV